MLEFYCFYSVIIHKLSVLLTCYYSGRRHLTHEHEHELRTFYIQSLALFQRPQSFFDLFWWAPMLVPGIETWEKVSQEGPFYRCHAISTCIFHIRKAAAIDKFVMPRLVKMHNFVRIRYKHMKIWDLKLANFYKTMVAPPPPPPAFFPFWSRANWSESKKRNEAGP